MLRRKGLERRERKGAIRKERAEKYKNQSRGKGRGVNWSVLGRVYLNPNSPDKKY